MDYFAALRAFVRSVTLGSFSAAAKEQGVKVSTISRHVAALEADVNAALLNRSTRSLRLTEAGTAFYERARVILDDLGDARAIVTALNSYPQGLLRITAPASFGRRHVMPHLPAFLAEYPEIRVDISLDDRTVDLIDAGMDVAIRIGALADSGLIASRLGPHVRQLVASPAWLASQPPICSPADIAGLECLSFALQPGAIWYYRQPGSSVEEFHQIPIHGRVCVNDSEALLQAAIAGLGIALLPNWSSASAIRDGLLQPLLTEWHWAMTAGDDTAIWGVYPPKKVVSPKVRAFLDYMGACFAEGF